MFQRNLHPPRRRQPPIPHDRAFDSTLALLREGYSFIPRRCQAFQSDIFAARLLLRKVTCVLGEDAARMFYQPGRFTRRGALPPTTLLLLQDYGSSQMLDSEAHRRRKNIFMSLMSPEERQRLVDLSTTHWRARFVNWAGNKEIVLLDEAEAVLCRAVCQWAGVPVSDDDASRRTAEFSAMIDGAGALGPRNWRGLLLRKRTERWARALIDAARNEKIPTSPDSALGVIAAHREPDGTLLRRNIAAIELINVLRPTVAVARYIMFGALAMHEHPDAKRRLESGDENYLAMFVEEVRRYYPFFTAVGGRVLAPFEWRGVQFSRGDWVLLDLYGSNHHPSTWNDPAQFRPERFAGWKSSGYDLIPQGGGSAQLGHRCPGEAATVELMKNALRLMATEIAYRVPPQDLRINLARMPALPTSRFRLGEVRIVRR